MKGIALIVMILLTVFYCLRLGYILTGYGHGGRIVGIPFAFIMIIMTIAYATVKKENRKENLFYTTLFYFLTLASLSITIEVIRGTITNYFALLYREPNGIINQIFVGFLVAGIVATAFKLNQLRKRDKHKKTPLTNIN